MCVCVLVGEGGGVARVFNNKIILLVNISVFTIAVSLHSSRLVCEAFVPAHVRAVNMCVYVFVRSDALDQN